jgi:hypothetical protein
MLQPNMNLKHIIPAASPVTGVGCANKDFAAGDPSAVICAAAKAAGE